MPTETVKNLPVIKAETLIIEIFVIVHIAYKIARGEGSRRHYSGTGAAMRQKTNEYVIGSMRHLLCGIPRGIFVHRL